MGFCGRTKFSLVLPEDKNEEDTAPPDEPAAGVVPLEEL